jgi:hypothetical protein
MGKSRDKRKRKTKDAKELDAKELDQLMFDMFARATLSGSNPPTLGEPASSVPAPLKPKPHIRSGAIAVPEPEPDDGFLTANPKVISK